MVQVSHELHSPFSKIFTLGELISTEYMVKKSKISNQKYIEEDEYFTIKAYVMNLCVFKQVVTRPTGDL